MDYLLKAATIIDPTSKFHNQRCDLIIKDGNIASIGENLSSEGAQEITANNLCVSPGWFDMRSNFRDPGHEYKEDLQSGINAAAAGGFTGVMLMPSTTPPINSKADVDYVKNKTASSIVDVHPAGTLSDQLKGENISGMYDMHEAGAVAFTDDKAPVKNASLMSRALLYSKNFNGLIISFANDTGISANGKINEGETSTMLGLKGIPALAEELQVTRDIYLTEYNESRLHFATISTAKSVGLIREAKAKGLSITAEVAAHQIAMTDSKLEGYDSNYKVMPPLRLEADVNALIEGLKDGTIDTIVSDHSPEDVENKKLEFDHAAFGIIGLETAFAAARTALKDHVSVEEMVNKMAFRPRQILQLDIPTIAEGQAANLTLFDPDHNWTFGEGNIQSKSKNSPFIGAEFTGKALGVINNGQYKPS
jgi:dihydroorotase